MTEEECSNLAHDIAIEIIGTIDGYLDNLIENGDVTSQDVVVLRNSVADLIISFIIFDLINGSDINDDTADAIINERLNSIGEIIEVFWNSTKNIDNDDIDFSDLLKPCNN